MTAVAADDIDASRVAMAPVSDIFPALVHVRLADDTGVSGVGAVAVIKAADWVVLAGAVMRTGTIRATEYGLRAIKSRPGGQTETEVGPWNVDTLTYNQHRHVYRPAQKKNEAK